MTNYFTDDPLRGPAWTAGLSSGVIVVEASERSGTLITARHAGEQGREVFAVPGPVDSATSAGCLHLIREGATLIRGVDDVLEALTASAATPTTTAGTTDGDTAPAPVAAPPPELDDAGRKVWEFLADGPRHVDVIAARGGSRGAAARSEAARQD